MKREVYITENYSETMHLGEEFADKIHHGITLALFGNLGSGKTTFIQGLAKGLGITKPIISPTFIIVREYKVSIKYKISSIKYFYHIDLYRINDQANLKELGIHDIINNSQNVVAIEWAEKMEDLLPKNTIKIRFEYLGDDKRRIIFNYNF